LHFFTDLKIQRPVAVSIKGHENLLENTFSIFSLREVFEARSDIQPLLHKIIGRFIKLPKNKEAVNNRTGLDTILMLIQTQIV
jgi:hypothetical protein